MAHSFLTVLRGYVRVRIRGMYCVRVLSACADAGIRVRDLCPTAQQELCFTVPLSDFLRLRQPVRRNACRLHILERGGLPLYLRKMRPRAVFFAGFAAVLALFWILTGYIWSFEVTGCQTLSSAQVLRILEEEGVKRGTRRDTVDPVELRNRILCRHHELIFLTLRFQGSHVIVEVRERRAAPAVSDDAEPRDLRAAHAGMISSVLLRQGTSLVSEGDLVEAGDTLVEGKLHLPVYRERSSYTEEYRELPVRADAEVYARVWTNVRTVCPLETRARIPAGEAETRFAVVLGGFRINIYFSSDNSFEDYDIMVSRKRFSIFPGVHLPVTLIRETVTPYTLSPDASDAEALSSALAQEALSRLRAATSGERLTVNSVRTASVNGAAYASAVGETLRDIAIP